MVDFVEIMVIFLSNLVLLLIGYLLTKNTVNRYQKNKESMEIKDSLVQVFCETNDKLLKVGRTWNKVLEEIAGVADSDVELRLLSRNPLVDEFIQSFHEFKNSKNLLTVRATVYLESDIEYAKLLEEFSSKAGILANMMENVLDDPSELLKFDDENNPRVLLTELGDVLNKIISFLFTAKIKR